METWWFWLGFMEDGGKLNMVSGIMGFGLNVGKDELMVLVW